MGFLEAHYDMKNGPGRAGLGWVGIFGPENMAQPEIGLCLDLMALVVASGLCR